MRALLVLCAACGSSTQTGPERAAVGKLEPLKEPLCVTKGDVQLGAEVASPTTRAVALGTNGDAAAMTFSYRGHTKTTKELASGQTRKQLGLKLRAANGCNLVYVMWRTDDGKAPVIDVSVKSNPGARTHADCGADGYTKVKSSRDARLGLVPVLAAGETHTLRAVIEGDDLRAWIDDKLVWQGTLPDSARTMVGPAGIRSDNLAYDLISFAAPRGTIETAGGVVANCKTDDGD